MFKLSFTRTLLAVLLLATPMAAAANYNPSCQELGYDFGFKIDSPPFAGTHDIDGLNSVTITEDGTYFDWEATLGMDAVIVKGGDNANVYEYSPEATSGSGLHSPPKGENIPEISHIEFCYDYEVDVGKTAEPSFTRTYTWSIDKSVEPAHLDLFVGGSGAANYEVTVNRTETDSNWAVDGVITIRNPAPMAAMITGVSDMMEGAVTTEVSCPVLPTTLPAGGRLVCTYHADLPNEPVSVLLNTAKVTTEGPVGGAEGTASVDFATATMNQAGYSTVHVNDTNGASWLAEGSATWTYPHAFNCGPEPGALPKHVNTATIVETQQPASTEVTVTCYAPDVGKTADTSFERHYRWSILKSVTPSELLLSIGQTSPAVYYTVAVGRTFEDKGFMAFGEIRVHNPAPMPMSVMLRDELPGAELLCTLPLPIDPGGTGVCPYRVLLPDPAPRLNTAVATLNGIEFTATAEVIFDSKPDEEFNECADVTDTYDGSGVLPAEICVPNDFVYPRTFGPFPEAGTYVFDNTACVDPIGDAETECSDASVVITVPPDGIGCTLTPGYWKTHSSYGPAPHDDTWAGMEDAGFFLSGQSYYEVLWTSPQGGNAYYILAHAWIAANLNIANGASLPGEVEDALTAGTGYFEAYTPADMAGFKGKNKNLRQDVLDAAVVLDEYNNGILGPGHCSE